MPDTIRKKYKIICEVRILHHYWLDYGKTVYDQLDKTITLLKVQEITQKAYHLQSYDITKIFNILPTTETLRQIKNLSVIFRKTRLGFILAAPENSFSPKDTTTTFEFSLTLLDKELLNYTLLTLRPQKTFSLYHETEKKTYQYKENVPVFSNFSGSSRELNGSKQLFLSREIPEFVDSEIYNIESLVRVGNTLKQLVSEQADTNLLELDSQINHQPVFAHQGDIPEIIPPTGLSGDLGLPTRGIELVDGIPATVFALIRLSTEILPQNTDTDFQLLDENGTIKIPHPVYQVRFKNRSTIWKYINKLTGSIEDTEESSLPLTHFGNAGAKQKPAVDHIKIISNEGKIAQLVSEVFIQPST